MVGKDDKDKALDILFPPEPDPDDEDLDDEDLLGPPLVVPEPEPMPPAPEPVIHKDIADVAALPKEQPEPDPLTVQIKSEEQPNVKKLDVDPERDELARFFLGEELFTRFKLLATGRGVSIGTLLDQGLQMCFDIGGFVCEAAKEHKRTGHDEVEHWYVNKRLRSLVTDKYEQVTSACRAYGVPNKEGFAAGIEAALDRGAI